MSNQELKTINQLKGELERQVHALVEGFQRRPECRGVQVAHIELQQVSWHNGYDEDNPSVTNPELRSGPDDGYRISDVQIKVILP